MALDSEYWSSSILQKDTTGKEFCYIPASVFLFGREPDRMRVPAPFRISRDPVTKGEFLNFVYATGYDYSDEYLEIMNLHAPFPNCPATPISWWDAKFYIRWLRKVTKEYYSLPTEIEWEFAARGKEGWVYPWGNSRPNESLAAYSGYVPKIKTSVNGAYPSGTSPFGCNDVVGNVWEWCLDSFDDNDEIHVLRGGSCADGIEACSVLSRRYSYSSTHRLHYSGFRITYLKDDMYAEYVKALEGEEYEANATVCISRESLHYSSDEGID